MRRLTPHDAGAGYDGLAAHWDSIWHVPLPAQEPLMYYATLGIPHTLAVLAEAGCVCRHLEYDQLPEPHVYLIAQQP